MSDVPLQASRALQVAELRRASSVVAVGDDVDILTHYTISVDYYYWTTLQFVDKNIQGKGK